MKKPVLLQIDILKGCVVSIMSLIGICVLLLLGLFLRGSMAEEVEEKLFNAAGRGDTETVELLVNQGVDVDGKDLEWYPAATPLTYAASGGHTDIVRFLINHHADATRALHQANEMHRDDIVRVLKAAGAKE
jgi:ankyrin repeat protein